MHCQFTSTQSQLKWLLQVAVICMCAYYFFMWLEDWEYEILGKIKAVYMDMKAVVVWEWVDKKWKVTLVNNENWSLNVSW